MSDPRVKQEPIKLGDTFTLRGCYVENPTPPKPPRFKKGEMITMSLEQADGSVVEKCFRITHAKNRKGGADLIVDPIEP